MLTTVRVHDYRTDPFPLLTAGVLPLLAQLADESALSVCFPTRHWDGGPHLALHLGYGEPAPAALAAVRERLAAAAGTGTAWSPEEYRRRVRALARAEGAEVRRALPQPHAAVAVTTDHAAVTALETVRHRFLSGLVRDLPDALTCDAATARSRAPGLALRWMSAVAAAYPGGARFGSLSFHSHAEAFLASRPDGEELRARFTETAERHRPRTDLLVDTALSRPEELPGYTVCRTALEDLGDPALRADLDALLAPAGRARDRAPAEPLPPAPGRPGLRRARTGRFRRLPDRRELAVRGTAMDRRHPLNRYLYCHCLANAVDTRLGEPWQDRLKARPV